MGATLDMDRIAKELGAERRGQVSPRGGYFGPSNWLLRFRHVSACRKGVGAD